MPQRVGQPVAAWQEAHSDPGLHERQEIPLGADAVAGDVLEPALLERARETLGLLAIRAEQQPRLLEVVEADGAIAPEWSLLGDDEQLRLGQQRPVIEPLPALGERA